MTDRIPDDAVLDAVARLTADVDEAESEALQRLQALAASAFAANPEYEETSLLTKLIELEVPDEIRVAVSTARLRADDLEAPPLRVVRRDPEEDLLRARVAGPLTALGGGEDIGPFRVGSRPVWFHIYRPERMFEVIETGASAPAMVITSARRPLLRERPSLDLQPGTVWIRGDLMDGALPAGAYVGINVTDGKLNLPNIVSADSDTIEVSAPLAGALSLQLEVDVVAPSAGGSSSHTNVELPDLTLTFGASGVAVEGGGGLATAWGHTFEFDEPTGTIEFLSSLWTLLVGYEVDADQFDASAISSDLADFQSEASVQRAALGLPVVVADPSILGPAKFGADWWIALEGVKVRWYVPDDRFHAVDPWLTIRPVGTMLFSEAVDPLEPPVTHAYRLWEIAEGAQGRLPWRQTYQAPFLLRHMCDASDGETLTITGSAAVVMDRPVKVDGDPVRVPTDLGIVHLTKEGDESDVLLGALISEGASDNLLSLRNALVWATRAVAVLARGSLQNREAVEAGSTQVFFGVYAWTPTLPDPYVGNFSIRRPELERPRALLAASIEWTTPADVVVSFVGRFGPPVVGDRLAGEFKRPQSPDVEFGTSVGLTQVVQGQRGYDAEEGERRESARVEEARGRDARLKRVTSASEVASEAIRGYLDETLGPTPSVVLIDVSTNQDLLGVAMWGAQYREYSARLANIGSSGLAFPVNQLEVWAPVELLRVVTLPQVQWEPVRTLDDDQDILTLGWFPTPLASATDGGATVLGARTQRLVPAIPAEALVGTHDAFREGVPVAFRTTLPFGLITVVQLDPAASLQRQADVYEITRPTFSADNVKGGFQVTALAEGGRANDGGVSPTFAGRMYQLLNGVDLGTGAPLGISVLGSTADPAGSVETVFNNDMTANPRVPVTRFDLSGYGGSNFSEWNNPFAAFAEASKVQFQVITGRTALEIIKVTSVLHPWGIRITRAITVERRPGGGVVRRDSGWQATTPGLFDYRFSDAANNIQVAPYEFDAGVFRGLFNVRSIRPATGVPFAHAGGTFVPYYFNGEVALEGVSKRIQAIGVLGWLQTAPSGLPVTAEALRSLIASQGPVGGPMDTWMEVGGSTMPFRVRRLEVGVADDAGSPVFVATVRGVPKLPTTGAWSVVRREVPSPPGGGEAVAVSENRGVPLIRRYPVGYSAGDDTVYTSPPLIGAVGPHRFADASDLLAPSSPDHDYCLLQSTPTHAFLFPRPYAHSSGPARIHSDVHPELADVVARSTSKGAFPPPQNAIQLGSTFHFDVRSDGALALSGPVTIVNHPTPLRLSGSSGHGAELLYDNATLHLELKQDEWAAEFTGLRIWSDMAGMSRVSGAELRITGSTHQRPQIAELKTLIEESIEKILSYIPLVGQRGVQGPIDLGASNAVHEIKLEVEYKEDVPKSGFSIGGALVKLSLGVTQSTGFDMKTGGIKASAKFTAGVKGEFPVLSVGAASVYIIVQLEVAFSITSVTGTVTGEKFDLLAFAGVGVKGTIGPFEAYAYLGIGFVLSYDIINDKPKYGGLVRLEAGVDLTVVKVKLRADLQGLVYDDSGTTKCDYSGSVKLQVDIFFIISISATYSVKETVALGP
jgi:hypothetical protein